MNETTQEQLSALLDGELQRDELRFLLRRLDSDVELARRWSRYQVASAVLRRQFAGPGLGEQFVAGVMERLEARPAAQQPLAGRMLRWAGGGAIAAAVAVFALVAVRPTGGDQMAPVAGSPTLAAAPAVGAAAPATVGELHQPLLPQQVQPAGFIDYAQPASFESIVPNYVPAPRSQARLGNDTAQGFVPYVLVVGSRQQAAHGPDQAEDPARATAQQR